MPTRRWLFAFILFLCMPLGACTHENDARVVEQIVGNTLFVAPSEQKPDEQYALTKIRITPDTLIYGKTDNQAAIQTGDTIQVTFEENSIVATEIRRTKN
ncbi:hypothetical protein ADM98_08960 [Exiguobacterium sp. BMC-KP]|uniref:hypothetical protein n=1 Tax=Exiguobacterium sp. BMC-KP TaxID=1684312 RepID=UPI0006AA26B4|nr:hypothetical protein [Exiguobacterium sp. BMC-KP]KOP29035.1 hypothetical protein ADM98_08960 [Exiguobacterium sp. BMC-KP]